MKKISPLITNKKVADYKPVFFDLKKSKDRNKFSDLSKKGFIRQVVDEYEILLKELFQVKNPHLIFSPDFKNEFNGYLKVIKAKGSLEEHGKWVYYPWLCTVVHILEHDDFYEVRTARNRNLINKQEQDNFYNATVGIAGLSVGNSVITMLVLQGGVRNIKLADHDSLELSNTNRIRTGIQNLGLPKVVITARQIYEMNPYARVTIYKDGITEKNLPSFFDNKPKLNVVIDEMDNLAMKYRLREFAKERRLPVVMAADNGDSGVIDIERYDLDTKTKFFHGRMGQVTYKQLVGLDKLGIGRMITKHVGAGNIPLRMQESLKEIGKSIVSWPQLGGAAMLNGAALAYAVRRIVNNQPLEKNRAIISLDEKLDPKFNTIKEKTRRDKQGKAFAKLFGL
jgi:hypothetical protein